MMKPEVKVANRGGIWKRFRGWGGVGYFAMCTGVLLASRAGSARLSVPTDCDETMNYYEPAHMLLHGTGLQTWEYSPEYALRSWLYVLIHAFPARVMSLLFPTASPKVAEFLAIRAIIAMLTSACDGALLACAKDKFGHSVSTLALVFLAFAPGELAASVAFLPSSFAMALVAASYASLLAGRDFLAIFFGVVAVLLGWPFAGLSLVPLAIAIVFFGGSSPSPSKSTQPLIRRFVVICAKGIVSVAAVSFALFTVDSHYFQRPVLAPWNIVLYNVVKQPEGGSTLYGTEPWYFYFFNGALNFNVALPLALLSLPLAAVASRVSGKQLPRGTVAIASAVYLWITFMSVQAHKEERFIFVVYSLISLSAAIGMMSLARIVGKVSRILKPLCIFLGVVAFAALSLSRVICVQTSYGASMAAWNHLSEVELSGDIPRGLSTVNVCVGKEWYRFSSSFFLPSSNMKLQFVQSAFTGELPQPFGEHTWSVPKQPFNDRNRMEPSRYVDVSVCHYLVDLEFEGQSEPMYSKVAPWRIIWERPFLDAAKSPRLTRSFYVPYVSKSHNKYASYVVLRNDQLILSEQRPQTKLP